MINEDIIINSDAAIQPEAGNDLYESRRNALTTKSDDKIIATVVVIAFNRLEKTKECLESVLINTTEIPYKLILVDNGSSDGTLEYFKGIEFSNKQIIRVTKNIGVSFPVPYVIQNFEGKYLVILSNDLVVTSNWLSNLIKCAMSDIKIGLVQPVSSNVSNYQQVNLSFSNRKDMQEEAEKHNESNPEKWHERMRIITLGCLFTRECLSTIGPIGDCGFFHDFGDDDLAFRIRRAGYKVILARDTWIHHNHDFRDLEDKNKDVFLKSLEKGRKNFSQKHFGIDAWDDVNNFEYNMISMVKQPRKNGASHVLGIDVKCGTPILELKNKLRGFGFFNTVLSAFIQDAKYDIDLKTICEGNIACDREEYLTHHFASGQFDYILLGTPINLYHEPYKILQDIIYLSKSDAQILFKLRNTFNYRTMLNILGRKDLYDKEYPTHIPVEVINNWVTEMGYKIDNIMVESDLTSSDDIKYIKNLIVKIMEPQNADNILNNIIANEYIISMSRIQG